MAGQSALARLTQAQGCRLIAAMADAPLITGAKRSEIAAREARLAHALRDNLRRRKEQARARETRADGVSDNLGATGQGADGQGANDEPPA